MTVFYTVTGNPPNQTRGISTSIRAEFQLIAAGFVSANGDITAKGAIAGQVWTGAHNFTGATITVPTLAYGTSGSYAVSFDALNAAVFASANLPAQTGKVGYALFTDGGTPGAPYWALVQGTGGTAITGGVTLTSTSSAAMTVTPTAPGLYMTLPVATTCTEAVTSYSCYNAGEYDYGVKDSAGTQLGWIRPKTGAVIGLSDNSTSAGTWTLYGLEKIGVTAAYVNSTLSNTAANYLARVALDANRTCLLFGGTSCYAIVYDASTQTWGAPTLVRSSIANLSDGGFRGILSGTDQVLVVSANSTTGFEAATLTISGTGVTVNAAVPVVLSGNFAVMGQLIAVGSSWVVSYGRDTTTCAIRAISISGTAPTIGSESALPPAISTGPAKLFASGAVVRTVSASTTVIYAKPYTVSGSTLSAGTQATATTTGSTFRAFVNGNGNIVAHYLNTTHFASVFKLTTTVEAVTSVSLGTVPNSIATHSDFVVISASKTLFVADAGSTAYYMNILTDTAGTATAGTELTNAVQNVTSSMGITASGNNARVGISTSGSQLQLTIDCSGASPTLASAVTMAYASGYAGGSFRSSDLNCVKNSNALMAGTSLYMLGSQADGAYTLQATPNAVSRAPVVKASYGATNAGAPGAAANEAWFVGTINNNSTGVTLNRIEAAA